MQTVLMVDPASYDAGEVLDRLGRNCLPISVAGPVQAVYALHALEFNTVLVPIERLDEHAYASLFATMRRMAPATLLIGVPPVQGSPDLPSRLLVFTIGDAQKLHEDEQLPF